MHEHGGTTWASVSGGVGCGNGVGGVSGSLATLHPPLSTDAEKYVNESPTSFSAAVAPEVNTTL